MGGATSNSSERRDNGAEADPRCGIATGEVVYVGDNNGFE